MFNASMSTAAEREVQRTSSNRWRTEMNKKSPGTSVGGRMTGGTSHFMGSAVLSRIGPRAASGPGAENFMGADGTRGRNIGEPAFMDKRAAMERAHGDAQLHVDNANAGARARAAEMGLDYRQDQAGTIAQAGVMAGAANKAGFNVDEFNVGAHNQFEMSKMQNQFVDNRFYANLQQEQEQSQQQQMVNVSNKADIERRKQDRMQRYAAKADAELSARQLATAKKAGFSSISGYTNYRSNLNAARDSKRAGELINSNMSRNWV